MKLNEWLKRKKGSATALANKARIHVSYITHIKKGRKRPSAEVAARIEHATGGQVSRMELLYPETTNQS